jgi:hypothetical protein
VNAKVESNEGKLSAHITSAREQQPQSPERPVELVKSFLQFFRDSLNWYSEEFAAFSERGRMGGPKLL